jgi:hypothetical protein
MSKCECYAVINEQDPRAEVCHNAESELCEKCEEPECACSGQVYPKRGDST